MPPSKTQPRHRVRNAKKHAPLLLGRPRNRNELSLCELPSTREVEERTPNSGLEHSQSLGDCTGVDAGGSQEPVSLGSRADIGVGETCEPSRVASAGIGLARNFSAFI